MRSLSTVITAATAAALAALAVTVTVPAIGDDTAPPAKGSSGPDKVEQPRDEADIRACLKEHGATAPEGDGRALKLWITGDHTPAEKAALDACGLHVQPEQAAGPDEATLRACLKDHGVSAPEGDGRTLKEWIVTDPTTEKLQALKQCGVELSQKPGDGEAGACGVRKDGATARGARPAGRIRGAKRRSAVVVSGT